jgi:hypothetical protein
MTDNTKTAYKGVHENDRKSKYGNRDLVGYGGNPVQPHWPRSAKLALNFVVNYEEGGESCILHGDSASEHLLSDIPGAVPLGMCSIMCIFILLYIILKEKKNFLSHFQLKTSHG